MMCCSKPEKITDEVAVKGSSRTVNNLNRAQLEIGSIGTLKNTR